MAFHLSGHCQWVWQGLFGLVHLESHELGLSEPEHLADQATEMHATELSEVLLGTAGA
jgi:hypothetical protein